MTLQFTKINIDPDHRLVRFGFGRYKGLWFIRVDFWSIGFRINETRKRIAQPTDNSGAKRN